MDGNGGLTGAGALFVWGPVAALGATLYVARDEDTPFNRVRKSVMAKLNPPPPPPPPEEPKGQKGKKKK